MSETVAVDTEKSANLCYGVTMINKENNKSNMTLKYALSVLETHYDATYRGTKTVREMCSSLTDWITWENESPDAVYHQFETKIGVNRIVADDDLIQLANHYAS